MEPIIEQDYILLFGYSILYKECNLTRGCCRVAPLFVEVGIGSSEHVAVALRGDRGLGV